MTPLNKSIYVFDATTNGVDSETKSFLKSYNKFGVFLNRIKPAKKLKTRNRQYNRAIAESLLLFKMKSGYNVYVNVDPNLVFKGHSLQILCGNAALFHSVSPVITNRKGLEVMNGIADRFGYNSYSIDSQTLSFVNGQIEETFSINHKCFALSNQAARRIQYVWESDDTPTDYVNALLFEFSSKIPRVDTNVFVHEELY
jgi:hypothetical protein